MPVLNSQASRFSRLSFVLSFSVLSPINLVQPTNNKLPRDQQFVISSVATLLRPACLPEWVKGVRQLQPLELQHAKVLLGNFTGDTHTPVALCIPHAAFLPLPCSFFAYRYNWCLLCSLLGHAIFYSYPQEARCAVQRLLPAILLQRRYLSLPPRAVKF